MHTGTSTPRGSVGCRPQACCGCKRCRILIAAMLKVLHNHIFAGKLRQVFASPLVFIYQSLGHVSIPNVSQTVQQNLDQQLPGNELHADVCRMRNSVASGAGQEALQQFFQASNLVVGFRGPMTQQQLQEQRHLQASRQSAIQELMGGALELPAIGTPRTPHLTQQTMKALINAGLQLPGEHPVVLVGAFFQRQPIKLAHLGEWRKLDAARVYSDLLGQLEAPLDALCDLDTSMEQLLGVLDDAGPHGVLQALDCRAADMPAA